MQKEWIAHNHVTIEIQPLTTFDFYYVMLELPDLIHALW